MTTQPVWKFLANLGDANPLEYGGYFVFEDSTGVYEAEAEWYDPEDGQCYRFSLDQFVNTEYGLISSHIWDTHLRMMAGDKLPYHKTLPYPITDYANREWFIKYLPDMQSAFAEDSGINLVDKLCSNNPLDRAFVYREVGEYWGFDNLDNYPLDVTPKEARQRYSNNCKKLCQRRNKTF